jgi:hypothetical protein
MQREAQHVTLTSLINSLDYAHHIMCGRGTTAIWLAVRALVAEDAHAEVIVPDVLCSTALDGVILAGAIPRFAAVSHDRFTVTAESIAAAVTPHTRAILVAHTFGHGVDISAIRAIAPHIPIIEDAVQGIGGSIDGRLIGTMGDVSVLSFHPTKLIDGQGGVLMFNDASLYTQIDTDVAGLVDTPQVHWDRVHDNLRRLLPDSSATGYLTQLRATYRTLLKPFDDSIENVERIAASWHTLAERVTERNRKARRLRGGLRELGLPVPELRDGDAIWRYTIAMSTAMMARQAVHALSRARLMATQLYPSLSGLMTQANITPYTDSFVNFWVDETVENATLMRVIATLKDLKTLTIDK